MADTKPKDIFPTLNSCCFCGSLRTASLVIGWYYLISGIIAVVIMVPKAYDFVSKLSSNGDTGLNVARLLVVESYFLIWLLMVACIYLINGIRKKIPNQVRPFVLYSALYLLYDIFVILLVTFTPLSHDLQKVLEPYWGDAVGTMSSSPYVLLLDAVLDAYFLLVVHSYYKQLIREITQNNPGAIV